MAERRMFAKTIIDSDAFLDMPNSTQNLYFHLGMRADDDGFINSPKRIQRMIGATDDDLKLLLAKNFLIPFESGVCVIKHWKIHNYIQKDRYKRTNYLEEKEMLDVKENGSYSLKFNGANKMDTRCIQNASTSDTQVRLGKVRLELGEDRLVKPLAHSQAKLEIAPIKKKKEIPKDFETFWNKYPKKKSKGQALKAWQRIKPNSELLHDMLSALEKAKTCNDWTKQHGQFIPYPATWLNAMGWEDDYTSSVIKRNTESENIYLDMLKEVRDDTG